MVDFPKSEDQIFRIYEVNCLLFANVRENTTSIRSYKLLPIIVQTTSKYKPLQGVSKFDIGYFSAPFSEK